MWTRELLSPAPPDGRNLYGARAEQAISSDFSREVVRTSSDRAHAGTRGRRLGFRRSQRNLAAVVRRDFRRTETAVVIDDENKAPCDAGLLLAVSIRGIHFIGVGPGEVALVEPEFTLSDSTPSVPRFAEPLVFAPVVLDVAWSGVLAPGAPGMPPWAASFRCRVGFHPWNAGSAAWAPVAGFCCASAKVLDSAKAVANAIVLSFMFVFLLKVERRTNRPTNLCSSALPLSTVRKNQPFADVKLRAVVPYEGGRDEILPGFCAVNVPTRQDNHSLFAQLLLQRNLLSRGPA